MMKKYLLLLLFVSQIGLAQAISSYRYVIVPSKFDAQKVPGQFGLNNLTKLFLEKNGYTVFYDTDILPAEVSGESCNKIYLDVYDDNTMRTTKLKVVIRDCRNAVLFTSDLGTSMDKDNKVAYNQALRMAFRSFDKPEYRYDPSAAPAVKQPVALSKTIDPVAAKTEETVIMAADFNEKALNAQPIANGFQLVDTTPKIVLKIFKTSNPDVFIAEDNQKKGVVYKKDGKWFFDYYQSDKLVSQPLEIKF